MNINTALAGNYLGKADLLDGPVVVTIADVNWEALQLQGKVENKAVMTFRDTDIKPWIVNKTNIRIMSLWPGWGDDTDSWRGKKVEIYHEPNVVFGKDVVGGLRCRLPGSNTGHTMPPADEDFDGPVQMSLAQARKACSEAGVDEKNLFAYLRGKGHEKYRPDICTPLVVAFIEAKKVAPATDGEQQEDGSDIPF